MAATPTERAALPSVEVPPPVAGTEVATTPEAARRRPRPAHLTSEHLSENVRKLRLFENSSKEIQESFKLAVRLLDEARAEEATQQQTHLPTDASVVASTTVDARGTKLEAAQLREASPPRLRIRPRPTQAAEDGDESELEIVRPPRRRLQVKTPESNTYYAREFEEFTNQARSRRREAPETVQPSNAGGHLLFVTGSLTWCWRCGNFSRRNAVGLKETCFGEPASNRYRLNRLKSGRHPVTNKSLEGRAKRLLCASV